jgi:hypothetical protein
LFGRSVLCLIIILILLLLNSVTIENTLHRAEMKSSDLLILQ